MLCSILLAELEEQVGRVVTELAILDAQLAKSDSIGVRSLRADLHRARGQLIFAASLATPPLPKPA